MNVEINGYTGTEGTDTIDGVEVQTVAIDETDHFNAFSIQTIPHRRSWVVVGDPDESRSYYHRCDATTSGVILNRISE